MSRLQTVLDRFIEISGDRTGELGESINTGLVWIGGNKVVCIADSRETEHRTPASWRRASRIIGVARQLRKPLLLWNLSFHNGTGQTPNLAAEQAARDSQQDIMQFPFGIVSVIEDAQKNAFSTVELALPDGIVFVDGAETLCGHLTISPRTVGASSAEDVASGISGLLVQIASIPANELVSQRRTRLASITLS
jgi:acetyl-CoA carboxylase alpha subunit